jgi:hypothetical protein
VWRGVSVDLTAKYQGLVGKGIKIHWWMINSCTANLTVADKFSGNNCTLFTISCKSGKEILYYSALGDEDEVILAPGTRFVVTGVAPQKRVVELEEDPPVIINSPVNTVNIPTSTAPSATNVVIHKMEETNSKETRRPGLLLSSSLINIFT